VVVFGFQFLKEMEHFWIRLIKIMIQKESANFWVIT
jgi:hypothetical protein